MTVFDADNYFKDRFASVGSGKLAELDSARNAKIADLQKFREAIASNTANYNAEKQAEQDSWVGQAGLDPEGIAGSLLNLGASAGAGISRMAGQVAGIPKQIESAYYNATLDGKDTEAFNRQLQGQATPQDTALLNQKEIAPGEFLSPEEHAKAVSMGARDGGNTKLDLFNKAIAARTISRNVVDSFDRSSIVHQGNRKPLDAALTDGSQSALDETKTGWQDLKSGNIVDGVSNLTSGIAQLLVHAGKAGMNNPMGVTEYVAENAPQFLLGLLGKAGATAQAMTNVGYASDYYQQGMQAYQAKHGVLPSEEQQNQMAWQSAQLALAEQAGDTVGVAAMGGRKALAKATGAVEQAATKASFLKSLKGVTAATVAGIASEAPTEGYQTYLEGEITGKPASAEDIYKGAAIGGMSGGLLSGGGRVVSELTGATPDKEAQKQQVYADKVSHAAAVQANDTSVYLDPVSPAYNPTKAASVLVDHAKLEGTTPEVQQENLTKVREVVKTLEADQERKQDLLDHIADPQAVADAKEQLLTLKTELSRTDPASTDRVIALKQHIAFREDVVTLAGDKVAAKRLVGEVKRGADQVSATQKLQEHLSDRLRVNMPEKDLANHIALASRSVRTDDMPAITESRNSAQALINLSMVSTTHLSPETAKALSNKGNALTPEQRNYFRQFSAARVLENTLMTLGKVSQAVLVGSKRDTGIADYRRTIGQALEAKDKKVADNSLAQLMSFAERHAQKLKIAEDLFSKVTHSGDKQVLWSDKGGWEVVPSGKPLDDREVTNNGGFTIHPRSTKLVDAIRTESHALNQAVREQKAAYAIVFTDMSKKVGPVDASDKPVQKEKQNVQVKPVAQTTATPSSVAPVTPAVQSTTIPGSNNLSKKPVDDRERVNAKALPPSAGDNTVTTTVTAAETTPTEQKASVLVSDIQPSFTDRVFRDLVTEENTLLQEALDSLKDVFPQEIKDTTFLAQIGYGAEASAFEGFPVIGIDPSVFTTEPTKDSVLDVSKAARIMRIVAHELGHLRDKASGYSTDVTASLQVDGAIFNEIKAVISDLGGQKDINKVYALYAWFNHIINTTNPKVRVHRELYAQLYALNFVNQELLNEYLPKAAKAIQRNHATNQRAMVADQSVSDGTGSTDVGTESSSETTGTGSRPDATTEIVATEPSAGTTEESSTGGLTALQGTKSPPDLPYNQRNLLVDHFTQTSQRPLVMVKDFISSLGDSLDFSGFIQDYTATDKQEAALQMFAKVANQSSNWSKALQKLLIHGYYTQKDIQNPDGTVTPRGTYREDKKGFYQNPFNWLISKDVEGTYSIEENTNTAMVYAGLSSLLELADAPQYSSDETINAQLGRKSDAVVPPLAREILGKVGMRANLIRNSAGKTGITALGLKADKDAGQNVPVQLESGAGGLVIQMLLDLKLATMTVVEGTEMQSIYELTNEIDGKDPENENTRTAGDNEQSVFISIARDPNTGKYTQAVMDVLESMRGSSGVLDKLMSVETQLKYPTFTAPENTQTTTKTGQQVPHILTEANDQNRAQSNFVRQDMWKVLNSISPEVTGALAGVETVTDEGTQKTKRESIKAKNDGLWRELNRYHDYVSDVLIPSANKLAQGIHFDYSVWLQQRVGIDTNVINPQTSKAHRVLFYRKSWESKIDLTNPEMLDNFRMRVGEGFGIKTERNLPDASLDKVTALFNEHGSDPDQAKTLNRAIAALQKAINTSNDANQVEQEQLSQEEQTDIQAAVEIGGENFHSLDALIAMAHYQQALDTGEDSFITHLQAGVDGVANGPILAHALFGAATTAEALNETMARGGIYTKESGIESFGEYRSDDDNQDLYEHNVSLVMEAVNDSVRWAATTKPDDTEQLIAAKQSLLDTAKAVEFFTGRLTKEGAVTSKGRNFIKPPVTELVFGAGIAKSLGNMADIFVDAVYDVFEKASKGDEDYPKADTIKAINVLLKVGRSSTVLGPNTNLMSGRFDKVADIKAIKAAFGLVFDEPVTAVIESNFDNFKTKAGIFHNVAELTHGLYTTVYSALRQQKIDSLVQVEIQNRAAAKKGETVDFSTGIPFKTEKGVNIPLRDLSQAEERQLEKQIAGMFPVMQTLLSKESHQPKAGLKIGKLSQSLSDNPAYETKVRHQERYGVSSANVRGMEKVQQKPGVGMLPLSIHSLDSYISHVTQLSRELLNIHDAVIGGVLSIHEATQAMNANTFHALLNYSPMLEMYTALENTVKGLDSLIEAGTLNEDVASQLSKFLWGFGKKNNLENTLEGSKDLNVIYEMLKQVKAEAAQADTLKLTAMQAWQFVNQYALENTDSQMSSYEVTEKDLETITQKLSGITGELSSSLKATAISVGNQITTASKAAYGKRMGYTPKAEQAKKSVRTDDMPAINESVKPRSYTTHELYNGLNKGDVSTGFDTHLQGILSGIVNKLHGTFGSFKADLMENTPRTADGVYAEALATDRAPFAFSLASMGLKFSDAQMFVAEQIHATMLSALASNDGRTSVVYTELSKLFRETRARLSTPESIYEGDWATASVQEQADTTALYQRIFNDLPDTTEGKSNFLAEFAALGLSHEGFNKLLQIPTKMAPPIMADKTIAGMLKRLLNKVLELFNGKLTNTMAGQQADQKLKALVEKLVDLENKRVSLANSTKGDFMKFVDKQAMTVRMGKKDLVSKLAHSKMFMKNKNVFIAAASGVVATLADSQVGTFFRNVDTLRNEYFPGQQTMITGFLSEMNGPKPVLQAMLRAVKHFEGKRKQIITLTNKFVLQAFDNQGKDLDDQDKRAITKVLLHTGAHTLLDHFDTDKLLTLLKDPKAMSQEIASFEGQLSQFTKGQQDYFIEQSKALGYFLVTGISKLELLNKSASNIAHGFHSVHDGVLSEADVKTASKTIDTLTTLYAMTYTAASDTGSLVKTLEKEQVRTDGGNGVRVVLLSHKEMEQQARERLFGGNEALMIKGYVPEIYNPHTSIKAATLEEGKLLLDMGYEMGASVQPDPSDKGAKAKHLYVLRDGGALPWLSGFFSFTGMASKGSSAHGQKAHRSQQALMKSKQAAVAARGPGQSGRNFDPTKVSVNHTVPLVNALGQAVDFHYMMQSNTKDMLLERDTRFDSVMGALNGSIFDKEESAVHNRKAAQVLFDEFDKGYSKEPNAYLRVSATSTDPELREIYKMLPKGTKDAIREIWGKDEMLVRSNNLDIAFGYRKRSLSNAFEKDAEDRTMMEESFVWFAESALALYARTKKGMTSEEADRYAKRAAVYVRRGENGWQELVKITKDIIVVKSGTVTLANMYSNFILLKLYGVSTSGALRDMRIAWVGAKEYKRDTERLFDLESQLASKTMTSGQADMRREVRELQDAIARNPVRPLIDAGLMPTIVEDASADEDIYSYKSAATRWADKRTAKLNPKLKAAGKQLAMTHDTDLYKGMAHIAQMGDFVARYSLYQHLKTQKEVPLTETQVLQEVSDAFINYDVPMQRDIQYWDDMMVLPFTKYFVRIQRVIRGRFKYAPGKVAMLLLAQSYLNMPTPLDASILFKFGNNPLSTGAFQLPGALDELATIHAGLSLFK